MQPLLPGLPRRIALLITLIAFGLRFPFLEARSLTIDEASSLKYVAERSLLNLLTQYHTNSHQLMSALAYFMSGAGHWLTFYRAPSLIFGLLTVPLLYQLGRRMFDTPTALLASLLLAAAPYHIDFSLQMRGYATETFWAAVTYYCVWQGLRTNRRRYWIWLAVASVLAIYAHLFGALAVGAGWIIILGTYLLARRNGAPPPWVKNALWSLLFSVIGLALLYGPIVARILATPQIETDWPSQIEAIVANGGFNTEAVEDYLKVFRLYGPMGEPRSALVWSFVLLAAFGAVAAVTVHPPPLPPPANGGIKGGTRAGWYILVWIFAPIAGVIFGLQFINGFYAYRRFFMFFQPLYLLLMAYGIISLGRLAGRWSRRRVVGYGLATALIVLALGAAGWKLADQLGEDTDNQWYRVAGTILAKSENPSVICEAYARKMEEEAAHKDECLRNLEFYLAPAIGETAPWLHREIDQIASIPGVANQPYLEAETGQVWLVLWQRDRPPDRPLTAPSQTELGAQSVGSSMLIFSPEPQIKLLALDAVVDGLLQIDTTDEDLFSYYLSQAQMKAIIGERDAAHRALLDAQALSPPGIDAENRLWAVAELIGMALE